MSNPQRVELRHGDCIELMRELPDNSIDSIVTDPPYGLEFMGKEWDAPWKSGTVLHDPSDVGGFQDGNGGNAFSRSRIRYGREGQAMLGFQAWFTEVATEALRVLKPGGHLLAFGGTRTYHRLAVAIEDAGFEIRDSMIWLYGSGFPKSHDVSKAIDKAAGVQREVVGKGSSGTTAIWSDGGMGNFDITAPATPAAQQWSGWGTALKPAHEPIVVARKPLIGTVAENVLKWGVSAMNIDGCRISMGDEYDPTKVQRQQADSAHSVGGAFGAGSLVGSEIPTYNSKGRWPANVVLSHTIFCEQIGERDDVFGGGAKATSGFVAGYQHDGFKANQITVPVWNCVEGCPVAELDRQSGNIKGGTWNQTDGARMFDNDGKPTNYKTQMQDKSVGGASRFFYVAKASKRERPKVDGVAHPTVKPLSLMRWLVRLVTPPNGTVLEPFAGSGTTVEAALLEGFSVLAFEKTADYLPLIRERIRRTDTGVTN